MEIQTKFNLGDEVWRVKGRLTSREIRCTCSYTCHKCSRMSHKSKWYVALGALPIKRIIVELRENEEGGAPVIQDSYALHSGEYATTWQAGSLYATKSEAQAEADTRTAKDLEAQSVGYTWLETYYHCRPDYYRDTLRPGEERRLFAVPTDWLESKIDDKIGGSLERFLNDYTWDGSEQILIDAREENITVVYERE